MKYAIRYYKDCPILDDADELIIEYTEKDAELINFAQNRPEKQRLIVDISLLEDHQIIESLDIFIAAYKSHNKNVAFLLDDEQSYVDIAEANLPFFFNLGAFCLDELTAQLNLGVSDIYITGEMGFKLKDIKEIAKDANVQIRVFPNTAQTSADKYIERIKTFFIRPEDIEIYDEVVDVFEFAGHITLQPRLYHIYNKGMWEGNLNTIIKDLHSSVNNTTFLPAFGLTRVNCGKRCAFDKCHICDHIVNISKGLEEQGVIITKEKSMYDEDESEIN